MNKIIRIIMLTLFVSIMFTACGSGEGTVKSRHILPSRIEQIDQGGVIPEGHEAEVTAESKYKKEMLWGTWVLKDTPEETATIDIGNGTTEGGLEASCFLDVLSFGPAWAGIGINGLGLFNDYFGDGRGIAIRNMEAERKNASLIFGQAKDYWSIDTTEEPMGYALEENGYGVGGARFTVADDSDPMALLNMSAYGVRRIAYSIHGDILAIGVTDSTVDEHLNETDILEINYTISLNGYKLQLTYGDTSVVYVPYLIAEREDSVIPDGFDLENAGIADGYEELDCIKGITILPEEKEQLMFNFHEGYVDAAFEFRDDGTITINSSKGDMFEYEYYYSGDALTLMKDGKTSVYSIYSYVLESENQIPTHTFYVEDNDMRLIGEECVACLLDNGFKTTVDLNQPIASYQITDEIPFIYKDVELKIKAVNQYDKPLALSECTICWYSFEDTTGVIQKGDGTEIGITTYDEIDFMYAPYETTDNILRYKGTSSGIIDSFDAYERYIALINKGYHKLMESRPHDLEVVYEFENGILSKIMIEDPELLYHGLQDNVDRSLLAQMKPEEFTGVIEIRDTILDTLRKAFASAGIQVEINESTGEILMDNDILFSVDEYELTNAGKQYIDSFMGVYASVITAEEFAECISEVLFEGHTDSTGSYGYNLILSQKRAEAVLNYCLNSTNNGLNDSQKAKVQELSTAIGHSSSNPILKENGKEDMDASRRVAIKFYVNVDAEAPEADNIQFDFSASSESSMGDKSQKENENIQEDANLSENMTENDNDSESTETEKTGIDVLIDSLDYSSMIITNDFSEKPLLHNFPMSADDCYEYYWGVEDGRVRFDAGITDVMFTGVYSQLYAIILNESEEEQIISECKWIGVMITDDMKSSVILKDGITLDSTVEEIISTYGTPEDMFEEDGCTFITYSKNRTIHFVKGAQNGIFFMAPEFSYGDGNFFYEAYLAANDKE